MPTAYDLITSQEVDTASEAYRHLCECRWLLEHKPTRTEKHLWLYGVHDRQLLMTYQGKLRDDWKMIAQAKSITHVRGLEAADRLLADARKIYELRNKS